MIVVKLPRLPANFPIVDAGMAPTLKFSRDWNDAMTSIEAALNAILAIPTIQDALANLDTATQAAQAAADAAAMAASTANDAAAMAQAQADAAAQAQAANAREQALINSYISPTSVISATPTTITIAAHTRYYADGTSVAVAGGTATATAPADVDYVSYSDPTRAGGAVIYLVTTTQPAQTGDTHVVGAVTVPTTGTQSGGNGPRAPWTVEP